MEIGHSDGIVTAGCWAGLINGTSLGSDEGTATIFVEVDFDPWHIGLFEIGGSCETKEKFIGLEIPQETPDPQNIEGGEDNVDVTAAGGET